MIVAQPSAITGIAELVAKAPLGVLKDQLLVRSLDSYSAYLPSAFDKESFAFYGTALVGHAGAGGALEARGRLHRRRSDRRRQQALRRALFPAGDQGGGRRAGRRMSSRRWAGGSTTLTWMTPETKVRAQAKLAEFRHQDRLSRASGTTIPTLEIRPRRPARQRHARRRMGSRRCRSASSAGRSAAGNGA